MSKGSRQRRKARIALEQQDPKWDAIRNLMVLYDLKIRRFVRSTKDGEVRAYTIHRGHACIGTVDATDDIERWVGIATQKESEFLEWPPLLPKSRATFDEFQKHWRRQSLKGMAVDEYTHKAAGGPGPDLSRTREAPRHYGAGQCKRPPAQDRMARSVRRK